MTHKTLVDRFVEKLSGYLTPLGMREVLGKEMDDLAKLESLLHYPLRHLPTCNLSRPDPPGLMVGRTEEIEALDKCTCGLQEILETFAKEGFSYG